MLKLKVLDRLLCLIQIYASNATNEYQAFVDEINHALLQVSPNESTVLMEDFNAYLGTNTDTWKGMIGKHGITGMNENGRYLLQHCCSNGVRTMTIFLQQRKFTSIPHGFDLAWIKNSLIDLGIVLFDLFSDVLDVGMKRGVELSTDHHLEGFLAGTWLRLNRKSNRSSV